MYQHVGNVIERRAHGEILRIEPWGAHAVRVRASADMIEHTLDWPLDLAPGIY